MRGARWLVLAACSVAMAFGSSAVRAGGGGTIEGGTITFVGSIVEPTCSAVTTIGDLSQMVSAAQLHSSLQRSCSGASVTVATPNANVSRPYEVDVVHLSSSESDHVLNYFANYVRAAQPASADPVLVTQTYE
jgi:type 1 fimbria pilin